MHNFNVVAVDTDSVFFKKSDESLFTIEEQSELIDELNSLMPERIRWEMNGYFQKLVTLKAKNYILWDGEKLKYKGSALKDSKKEIAVKDFMKDVIYAIIHNTNNFEEIYKKYILEAMNVTDIKRWSSKKTVTAKVFSSERKNETKIKDALNGSEYVEGDKVYLVFKNDDTLCLAENFDGDYNKNRLLKKLYDTSKVFNTILPENTFINYTLKRNEKKLQELLQ